MKILHTADWHLGQRFYDNNRNQEHADFLKFLLDTIQQEKIDLLIVAGDIFDTANPPREAEKMYYDFLKEAHPHCQILITAGNHDSAPHIDAPASILEALNTKAIGALPTDLSDALFHFKPMHCDGNGVLVSAIPFLRDKDIRSAIAGESFDDMESRTKKGILSCYEQMASLSKEFNDSIPHIATGHLTVIGGKISEGERSIHIGKLGSISVQDFPETFDYIALGHLHKPQHIGDSESVRYSGSPIPLSFSEITKENTYQKEMRLIEIQGKQLIHSSIPIPNFRPLLRFHGDEPEIKDAISHVDASTDYTPWIEINLTTTDISPTLNEELRVLAEEKNAEVLKIGIEKKAIQQAILSEPKISISELEPLDIFKKRLNSYEGEVPSETLLECFNHILNKHNETL